MYPYIRYAELNHYINFFATNPNDNFYQSGEFNGYTSAINGINLPAAWFYGTGVPQVKIGVYDSGINFKHEDFGGGTFATSKLMEGKNYLTNVATSTETNPDNDGHGTAIAGIIGALSNNGKGVSGVAGGDVAGGNTGCSLVSMRLGDGNNQANAATIANAIVEGVSWNPNTQFGFNLDVTNHSYGVEVNNAVVEQAVATSYNNSSIFVASSGNAGKVSSIDAVVFPATYFDNGVLKVGASDATGTRASFSVYDNNLDIIAPGTSDQYICVDHNSTNGYVDAFSSPSPDAGLNIDGTSFSAPHVAGVAGLMMSVHNPAYGAPSYLAPEDVEKIIQDNAIDLTPSGYDKFTGYGRLDAGKAVSKIFWPRYYITHPSWDSQAWTQGPNNQQVVVANNVAGVAAGIYFAQRHTVTWGYSEIFPVGHQILDWWERTSSEFGVDAATPISGQLNIFYNVVASGSNFLLLNVTTSTWDIQMNIIGQTIGKWLPGTPASLRAAFSIYVYDPSVAIGMEEVKKYDSEFNLYPNPTKDILNISFGDVPDEKLHLEIVDALGHVIVDTPCKVDGMRGMSLNMGHLAAGVYFCKLTGTNLNITKRFVKVD